MRKCSNIFKIFTILAICLATACGGSDRGAGGGGAPGPGGGGGTGGGTGGGGAGGGAGGGGAGGGSWAGKACPEEVDKDFKALSDFLKGLNNKEEAEAKAAFKSECQKLVQKNANYAGCKVDNRDNAVFKLSLCEDFLNPKPESKPQ